MARFLLGQPRDMRTSSRLSLALVAVLLAALSGDAARAEGTVRGRLPGKTWRKQGGGAGHRRAAVPARNRNPERLRARLAGRTARRPRLVASGSASNHPALGVAGPLGPYGPLGRLGPLVDAGWSPARWMRAIGAWSQLSALVSQLGGPLSEDGPLGPGGPQGDAHAGFPPDFLPGGTLSALGPDGPLGALGPLGPLGPLGAHGFARDRRGRYLEGTAVRRTVTVPTRSGQKSYPLFEVYDADQAAGMTDNDTSFMAVGALRRAGAAQSFPFRSRGREHVHITLTPHAELDRFRLEVFDGAGNLLTTREHPVDPIVLWVPGRTRLTARLSLVSSGHLLPDKPFSLAVVGRSPD